MNSHELDNYYAAMLGYPVLLGQSKQISIDQQGGKIINDYMWFSFAEFAQ
jgi:hypothetical protein